MLVHYNQLKYGLLALPMIELGRFSAKVAYDAAPLEHSAGALDRSRSTSPWLPHRYLCRARGSLQCPSTSAHSSIAALLNPRYPMHRRGQLFRNRTVELFTVSPALREVTQVPCRCLHASPSTNHCLPLADTSTHRLHGYLYITATRLLFCHLRPHQRDTSLPGAYFHFLHAANALFLLDETAADEPRRLYETNLQTPHDTPPCLVGLSSIVPPPVFPSTS